VINLKRECKEIGMTVEDFCLLVDVPYQTVSGWSKSRPVLLEVLFNGLACSNILDRIEELRDQANEQSRRFTKSQLFVNEDLSPRQAVYSFPQEREAQ